MAVDSASHIIGWNVKNGWYPRGRPVTTPVSLSRKRFHSYGALSEDDLLCRFYDRADSKSFCDFLGEIHREIGKAVLVLDNASIHKSKAAMDKLDELDGDIVLHYIPPYTPELNPIEVQWRMIKKATANTLYETTDAMKGSIRRMLESGEIGVAKMSQYLR